MNFRGSGRSGLRGRGRAADGAIVDLTPLIDVTFQLLIFFLLTATFNNDAAFKVKLPKASANDPATEVKAIVVEISEDGRFEVKSPYYIGGTDYGFPVRGGVLDIVEVGTGGGSIAWLDDQGRLAVGPKSAGSSPGPACYGRGGTQPTITDANLVLGRIGSGSFLGGEMQLDVNAARNAIASLAGRLGMTGPAALDDTAHGIIALASLSMASGSSASPSNVDWIRANFRSSPSAAADRCPRAPRARTQPPEVIIPPETGVFSGRHAARRRACRRDAHLPARPERRGLRALRADTTRWRNRSARRWQGARSGRRRFRAAGRDAVSWPASHTATSSARRPCGDRYAADVATIRASSSRRITRYGFVEKELARGIREPRSDRGRGMERPSLESSSRADWHAAPPARVRFSSPKPAQGRHARVSTQRPDG